MTTMFIRIFCRPFIYWLLPGTPPPLPSPLLSMFCEGSNWVWPSRLVPGCGEKSEIICEEVKCNIVTSTGHCTGLQRKHIPLPLSPPWLQHNCTAALHSQINMEEKKFLVRFCWWFTSHYRTVSFINNILNWSLFLFSCRVNVWIEAKNIKKTNLWVSQHHNIRRNICLYLTHSAIHSNIFLCHSGLSLGDWGRII